MIAHHREMPHGVCVNFRDYLLGRRVVLTSPLEPSSVERAVRNGTKSVFNPFYTGVVGWCRFGRVGLRWATAIWSNGFQPVLSGKFRAHSGGTQMTARFGAPVYLLVFFAFWYFALTNLIVIALTGYVTNPDSRSTDLLMIPAALGFMAVPLAFHFIFNRSADEHCERILILLSEIAELETVVSTTRH